MWYAIGWIVAIFFTLQLVYSLFYHKSVYARLAKRADACPESDDPNDQWAKSFGEDLAKRYLRNICLILGFKTVLLMLLLLWLLRHS